MIGRIGSRAVGDGQPCFIIAEIGVNHNGDLILARDMIDAACNAGADAVKIQTFTAGGVVTRAAEKPAYQLRTTGATESQYDMLRKLELSEEQHYALKEHADRRGAIFLSTPYDAPSVDLLMKLGVPALKVSSADITNHPLLRHMAATGLPVILSTGMSTLGEVEAAVSVLDSLPPESLFLLQCNFNYPARVEDVNLRAILTLRDAFGRVTGYSDHTPGLEVSVAAVALGAAVIEKHFTLDRNLPGPDHAASAEPAEFASMVRQIRNVEKALGSPVKQPSGDEVPNRRVSRRSIVAAVDIPAGTTLTDELLAAKRPATGISPASQVDIVGRVTRVALRADEQVTWDKLR